MMARLTEHAGKALRATPSVLFSANYTLNTRYWDRQFQCRLTVSFGVA